MSTTRLWAGANQGRLDPGPNHGDRRERRADDPGAHVVVRPVVGEVIGGGADHDDDRRVVQLLQRRGGAVGLERIAIIEATPFVGARTGGGGGLGCTVSRVEREDCAALTGDGYQERRSRLRTAGQPRR
jgi:hypothetical protein